MVLLTWSLMHRSFVQLLSPPMLRRKEAALVIQAAWRGHHVRGWFRPLVHFLGRRLQLSIARERAMQSERAAEIYGYAETPAPPSGGSSARAKAGPSLLELLINSSAQAETLELQGLPAVKHWGARILPSSHNVMDAARTRLQLDALNEQSAIRRDREELAMRARITEVRGATHRRSTAAKSELRSLGMHIIENVTGTCHAHLQIADQHALALQEMVAARRKTDAEAKRAAREATAANRKHIARAGVQATAQLQRQANAQAVAAAAAVAEVQRCAVIRKAVKASEKSDSRFAKAFNCQISMMTRTAHTSERREMAERGHWQAARNVIARREETNQRQLNIAAQRAETEHRILQEKQQMKTLLTERSSSTAAMAAAQQHRTAPRLRCLAVPCLRCLPVSTRRRARCSSFLIHARPRSMAVCRLTLAGARALVGAGAAKGRADERSKLLAGLASATARADTCEAYQIR